MRTLDSAATAVGIRWRFCLLLRYIVICCLIGRNSDCHEDRSPLSITTCFRWFFPILSSFLFLSYLFRYFFFLPISFPVVSAYTRILFIYIYTCACVCVYIYYVLSVQKSFIIDSRLRL